MEIDIITGYDLSNYPVNITNSSVAWDGSVMSQITYTTILPNNAILDVSFIIFCHLVFVS